MGAGVATPDLPAGRLEVGGSTGTGVAMGQPVLAGHINLIAAGRVEKKVGTGGNCCRSR